MMKLVGYLLFFLGYFAMAMTANYVHLEVNVFGVVVGIPMGIMFLLGFIFVRWPSKGILLGGVVALGLSLVLAWVSYQNMIVWPMVVFGILPAWVVFGAISTKGFKDPAGFVFRRGPIPGDAIVMDLPEMDRYKKDS